MFRKIANEKAQKASVMLPIAASNPFNTTAATPVLNAGVVAVADDTKKISSVTIDGVAVPVTTEPVEGAKEDSAALVETEPDAKTMKRKKIVKVP